MRSIDAPQPPNRSNFFRQPEHRLIRFHYATKEETLDEAGVKVGEVEERAAG